MVYWESVWGPFCGPLGEEIISRRRKEGWVCIKRIKKFPGDNKSPLQRDVILPGLFFLFLPVSAIMCFLVFPFTVFIVSLLHCEHLAIGVQPFFLLDC